jgi:hypothetical protein
MKVLELLAKSLEHESMWQLIDHLAVERLKESRGLLIEDRERLTKIADERGLLPHQRADWEDTVMLIAAFNRVIEYYGGD